MDSDTDDMGVILCDSDFRYRKELENYTKTSRLKYKVEYFVGMSELSRALSYLDDYVILLNDFEGELFEKIIRRKPTPRIVGPPAFKQAVVDDKENESFEKMFHLKQLFCKHLENLSFVLGGENGRIRQKLQKQIRYMGGLVRENVDHKTNFLGMRFYYFYHFEAYLCINKSSNSAFTIKRVTVTTNLKSTKYNHATAMDIPVLKRESVSEAWQQRTDKQFKFEKMFYEPFRYQVIIRTHKQDL